MPLLSRAQASELNLDIPNKNLGIKKLNIVALLKLEFNYADELL
jgi:hypothetical protein